jgi:hypothetical protein
MNFKRGFPLYSEPEIRIYHYSFLLSLSCLLQSHCRGRVPFLSSMAPGQSRSVFVGNIPFSKCPPL